MGLLVGAASVLTVGQPVGAPTGEIEGVGIIAVRAVVGDEAEADAIELVSGVDGGTPDAQAAFLGGDEGLTEGGVMTGGQGGHPGEDMAIEGVAVARDLETGIAVAGLVETGIEADKGPDPSASSGQALVGPVEAWGRGDEVEIVGRPKGGEAPDGGQVTSRGVHGQGLELSLGR